MDVELSPEPSEEIAGALVAAIERALAGDGEPGPWWRAGLEENLASEVPPARLP
jgi:hypothetical protein